MKEAIPLKQAFALYLNIANHSKSYRTAKYALDRILRDASKRHVVFMDAYDLCNFVFPKKMLIDSHHDIVERLWLEFFSLCKRPEIPFNIQVVIPPAAAFEIVEVTYDRITPVKDGFTLRKNQRVELSEMLTGFDHNWRNYVKIEPYLDKKQLAQYAAKLGNLLADDKLVEFEVLVEGVDIFENAKGMKEVISHVSEEVNFKKGIDSFAKRRPSKTLSNEIDMRNFVTCVAFEKSIARNENILVSITSHSGHTLGGWSASWELALRDAPIMASLSENITVTSVVEKKGDIAQARDFAVEGEMLSRSIGRDLESIPQIRNYMEENTLSKRKSLRNKYDRSEATVQIPTSTLYKIEEWNSRFVRTQIPSTDSPINECDYKKAMLLSEDETYREELAEEASMNARAMFSRLREQKILSLDMLFIPEDKKCVEIFEWLQGQK